MAETVTAPQKRMLLSGLREIPQLEAVELAASMLDDKATENEAARAIAKIATRIPTSQRNAALNPLKKAVGTVQDPATRQAVTEALKQIETGKS